MISTCKSIPRAFACLFLCLAIWLSGCGSTGGNAGTSTGNSSAIPPPRILPTALPLLFANTPFTFKVIGVDGTSPYTYLITSGSLPPGLTLSPTGSITGSASATGSYSFTVTMTDAGTPASTASATFSLVVTTPLRVSSQASLQVLRYTPVSTRLLSGGTQPYTPRVISGSLPDGLYLNADGTLAGTPTKAAPFTATITWTDAVGQSASSTLNFLITAPPLVVAPVQPIVLTLGDNLAQAVDVQGGTPPYTFALTNATVLPTGLTLSPTGVLLGTANSPGKYTFAVTVSDGTLPQQTVTVPVAIAIATSTVQVTPSTVLHTVSPVAYGVHTSVYDQAIGDVSGIAPRLATAGARVLRFPGGSYSDRYHWAQHTLTPNFAPSVPGICATLWNGFLGPHSDFGNFVHLLQSSGTTGIVTVNYGTSVADKNGTVSTSWSSDKNCSDPNTGGQPEEAAAWVAYANGLPSNTQVIGLDETGFDWKTVGFWAALRAAQPLAHDDGYNFLRLGIAAPIGIRYWEVGNEIYYNGYNSILTETDLHAPFLYSQGYDEDPDSREGIADLSPSAYGYNAARFANAMHAVDPTVQVGIVLGSAIDPVPATWTPSVLTAACSSARFDFAILHYYPGTYNAVTTDQLLTNPQADLPGLVQGLQTQAAGICGAARGSMPVFMTETNPNGAVASTTPDVASGLFSAHVLLTAFQSGITNAEWLELHAGAGTFLDNAERPGPAFYGFQLAHLLAAENDQLVASTNSSSNILVHAARQSSGQLAVMLINRSSTTPAFVNVQGMGALTSAVLYQYGQNTTQTSPQLVGSPNPSSDIPQVVSVPPLTAVVLVANP